MRKYGVLMVALVTFGFLVSVVSAGQVSISGTHSEGEIKATCNREGGVFESSGGGAYGCAKGCGEGEVCRVECVGGKCTGSCPKCGQQERRLPVLRGDAAAERILKNSVERSKRY
jgi:hypothetical protein